MAGQRYIFGSFTLDAGRGSLLRDGVPVTVGQRALSLLHALVQANGAVVSKTELIDTGWPGLVVEESNLSVQIAALRKLLGAATDGAECIATVSRVGYRFCLPVKAQESRPSEGDAGVAAESASIAVLPLANLTGDAGQEYLADGISEDIIMALSRFRWFRVIGRSASFAFKNGGSPAQEIAQRLNVRYVLEGSLRRFASQWRVAVQLVDARSSCQLWSERYDFAPGDMLAIQDRIAQQVAGAIEPELLKTEAAVAARWHGGGTAQELVHRGTWLFHQVTRSGHLQARDLFRQACRLDEGSGQAQFWLARVSAGVIAYGWSEQPQADIAEGLEAAARAIRADEKNPYGHYALAITSVWAGLFDQGERAAQRSTELVPGFALGHLVLGMARLFHGDAAGATAPLKQGLHLNPFDPQNFVWYNTLAYAHLFSGAPAPALEAAHRAQEVRPDWAPAVETAVCCLQAMGDMNGARALAEKLPSMPRAAGDALAVMKRHNRDWERRIESWLAGASAAPRDSTSV